VPRHLPLVLVVASAAAAVPGTAAAQPWNPATSVGPAAGNVRTVLTSTSGATLIVARRGSRTILQPVGPLGVPGRTRRLRSVLDVAAYGNRTVVLHRSAGRRRVSVSIGSFDGRLGRPRTIHRGRPASARLAVGPGGQVLVGVGVGGRGSGYRAERMRLVWSMAAARRTWRSTTLARRGELLAAAVDDRSNAVLLIQRRVGSSFRLQSGHLNLRLRRKIVGTRTLARTRDARVDGVAATGRSRTAVLAWGSQDAGRPSRPYVVAAAVRTQGKRYFRRPSVLDTGTAGLRPVAPPVAAINGNGNVTVAWSQTVAPGVSMPRAATAYLRTTRVFPRFRPEGNLLATGYVRDAVAFGFTTFVSIAGSSAPYTPGAAAPPTTSGVLARWSGQPFSAFEPIGSQEPLDLVAPAITVGPGGFRAAWKGGTGSSRALRFSARPLG
jgi:hypothetical protein